MFWSGPNLSQQTAGISNLTQAQVTPYQAINSYWTVYFITASNGHDYFLVGHAAQAVLNNEPVNFSRVSLLDIKDKVYFGTTMLDADATLSTDTFSFHSPHFQTYASTPDQLSTMVSISSVKNATFSLVSQPRGPNLYDGGSGHFFWGNGMTFEFGAPECYVTGNITYQGRVIDVIPEKSMAWYDRQFGPGFGVNGWNLFIFYLTNGVKACIWHSSSVGDGPEQRFVTFMFPDGHHEVYPIDEDIHPSVPFTSSQTGFTYYGRHQVHVLGIDTWFIIELPVLAGEMTNPESPTPANTLFEGFSLVKGIFKGSSVTGWGVSEQRAPS
jgi:hypothetical protein